MLQKARQKNIPPLNLSKSVVDSSESLAIWLSPWDNSVAEFLPMRRQEMESKITIQTVLFDNKFWFIEQKPANPTSSAKHDPLMFNDKNLEFARI